MSYNFLAPRLYIYPIKRTFAESERIIWDGLPVCHHRCRILERDREGRGRFMFMVTILCVLWSSVISLALGTNKNLRLINVEVRKSLLSNFPVCTFCTWANSTVNLNRSRLPCPISISSQTVAAIQVQVEVRVHT